MPNPQRGIIPNWISATKSIRKSTHRPIQKRPVFFVKIVDSLQWIVNSVRPKKHTLPTTHYPLLTSSTIVIKLSRTLMLAFALITLFASYIYLYTPALAPVANAAPNNTVNFQARLLTNTGALVPDGLYNVEFKLYDAASGGTLLWTDNRYDTNGVTAGNDYRIQSKNGYITVALGDTSVGGTAFPGTIDWSQELWLSMNIGGTTQTATPTWNGEMSPRMKVTSTPYAQAAASAQTLKVTDSGFTSTISVTTPTANRTINFPNASGTVAVSASGNIALDVAGNITLTGQIPIANGGTGASSSQGAINALSQLTTDGDLLYFNGTNSTRFARGANGECLKSNTTTIIWGTCGAASGTLQSAYDAGGAGDQVIALSTTNDSLIFRNPSSGGTNGTGYVLTIDQLATGAIGGMDIQSAGTGNLLRIRDTTATAQDVLVVADGGAVTLQNQTDSTGALRVLTQGGTNFFNVDSTNQQLSLRNKTDAAVIGADIFGADNNTCSGTNWTDVGVNQWSHTSGNTTALVCTSPSITTGTTYEITYTTTGTTSGQSFLPAIGGVSGSYIYGNVTTETQVITTTATTTFRTTPTSTQTGTITIVSIKPITNSSTSLTVKDSTNLIKLEIRAAGTGNLALGFNSLQSNTTGSNNTALGTSSLQANTTGGANTALGTSSLQANTTGQYNTAVGYRSLQANTTGQHNTASGYYSLQANTTGDYNSAFGYQSLLNNITGTNNSAFGRRSLIANATGFDNSAFGSQTLQANTTGYYNTAIGSSSLYANTTGINNTASGYRSLYDNTTGSDNTGLGYITLFTNTIGNQNTAVGNQALYLNDQGSVNVAVGYSAMSNNTSRATALGSLTGGSGYTDGVYNNVQSSRVSGKASGYGYPTFNVTVSGGTVTNVTLVSGGRAVDTTTVLTVDPTLIGGTGSGFSVPISSVSYGDYNVAVGANALDSNAGDYNTAVGFSTLTYNTGSYNSSLGYYAGYQSGTQFYFKTLASVQRATALGSYSQVYQNNTVALGGQGADAVKVGIGTGAPTGTLSVEPFYYRTGTVTTTASSSTVTGAGGASFTAAMVGSKIYIASNSTAVAPYAGTITAYNSATDITVSPVVPATNAGSGQQYYINYVGLQVQTNGNVGIGVDSGTGRLTVGGINTTEALKVQTETGTDGLIYDTTNQQLSLRNKTDTAVIGADIFGADNNTCTGTNWTDVGVNQWSHTSGSTANLVCTSPSITAGTTYEITYTTTGTTTDQSFRPQIGGVSGGYIYGNVTTETQVITTTTTTTFRITPTSTQTGTITIVSIKPITNSSTSLTVKDSTNTAQLEVRAFGTGNLALGYQSLQSNTTGTNNTATGYQSLQDNTFGIYNTANGYQSLQSNTTGNNNTALGYQSLQDNTTGFSNTSIGIRSLQSNTIGALNTAIGNQSMTSNTTGGSNTATGAYSLWKNTVGSWNSATGHYSMSQNTTGNDNTANGPSSLGSNTSGNNNTAIGKSSLYRSLTGSNNTALGSGSLEYNYSGANNTASGYNSLYYNATGSENTASGYNVLYNNTNTLASFGAIVGGSGYTNGTYNNVTLTLNSGPNPSTYPVANITVSGGAVSGVALVSGGARMDSTTVFTAPAALIGGTGSGFTVAVGSTTSGNYNTALGTQSLYANTVGSYNSAVGYNSGYRGSQIQFQTNATLQQATALGSYSQVYQNNTVALGGQGADTVKVGIGTGMPTGTLSVEPFYYRTGSVTTTASSGTVTGAGTTFTAAMVGSKIYIASNSTTVAPYAGTITAYNSATDITVSPVVPAANAGASQQYYINYVGLQVKTNGDTQLGGNLLANGIATNTTGTTEATARTNVTTVTLTAAGAFANNDIIFIDNAGQDYYTRITAGGGTTTLTVSPAVSYDVSATVTKYNVQNIGATTTDYTTQSNRYFQGYFLGGVVTGAGSTTLSDGNLNSTGNLYLQPSSTGNLQVGSSTTDATANLFVLDSYNNGTDPTGVAGAQYYNTSLNKFRCYENGAWANCIGSGSGVTTVGAFEGGTANANGATITGSNIFFQAASSSYPGMVTTGAQTLAGTKTFSSNLIASADLTVDTNTFYVDSTNNRVGIGTNNPNAVGGDLVVADQQAGATARITTATGVSLEIKGLFEAADMGGGVTQVNLGSLTNHPLAFYTNSGLKGMFTTAGGGGLLLGNTFTNGTFGSAALELRGSEQNLVLNTTLNSTNRISFYEADTASMDLYYNGTGSGDANAFAVRDATNFVNRLTVLRGGNVGVGMDSPSTKLQVNGALTVGDSSATNGSVLFENSSNANIVTMQTGVTSASYNLVIPTSAGAVNDCLKNSGTTAGTLIFGSCGSGGSLFTDAGTYAYLTTVTDDLAIGDTTDTGASLFVDESAGSVRIGDTTTLAGTLYINDGSSNTVGITAAGVGTNYTLTLPTGLGSSGDCLKDTTGAGILGFVACGGGGSLFTDGGAITYLTATADNLAIGDSTATASELFVDEASGTTTFGNATKTGEIALHDGNGQTTLIQAGNSTGNLIFTFPTTTGAINECLQNDGTTPGTLIFGSCSGTGSTLQGAYTAATASPTPEIIIDATRRGVDIQDVTGGTIGATEGLFNVRGVGTASTLGASLFTVQGNGRIGINNGSTSTTPTVSYDLSFGQGANRTIGVETQATAATAGNNLTVTAGTGNTTGVGGNLVLQAGQGGATATGGQTTVSGGNGGATSGAGGILLLQGGSATTSGAGGVINITGGAGVGTNQNGGTITITAGAKTGTGTGGQVIIKPGTSGDRSDVLAVQNAAGSNLLSVTSSDVSAFTGTTAMFNARRNFGMVYNNGFVYIVGGVNSGTTDLATIYYNTVNANGTLGATWTATTSLPAARSETSTFIANGYLYVLGGYLPGGSYTTSYYAKINSDGTLGTFNTTTALPAGRGSAGTVVANGYVYIIGGTASSGVYTNTAWSAKLNADGTIGTWNTSLNTLAANRSESAVVYNNGYIYVMGGWLNASTLSNTVYYAKVTTSGTLGAWNSTTVLTGNRAGATAVTANGKVYHIGGSDTGVSFTASILTNTFNADGTVSATWTTNATAIPTARSYLQAIVVNDKLIVMGGYSPTIQSRVDYATLPSLKVNASLDLVGGTSSADYTYGGSGGNLTAGNTRVVGTLDVRDVANFTQGAYINGELAVGGTVAFRNNANSTGAFQIQNATGVKLFTADTTNMQLTANGNLVANSSATVTTGTTEAVARTNVTTVTLTAAGAFANNDVIFINNAGQDYYTRITAGGGTTTLTVSPAVSYDISTTVTKYNVQNIGATSTDYATQANRFFQGYFLGGVVAGAGSTVYSDGMISAGPGLSVQNPSNSTAAFTVKKSDGTVVFAVDTTGNKVIANGTDGLSATCSGGQVLQNQVVSGGIVTGGTCATAGGGGSLFTDAGTFTYLTSATDDLVVGDTTEAGASLFVDESAGSVRIGDTTNLAGTLYINDGSSNTVGITAAAVGSNFTLTLPATIGAANQCIKNSGTVGVLTFDNCNNGSGGSGVYTMQEIYNASSPASITTTDNKNIAFNLDDTATDSDFIVNLNGTGNTFEIQDSSSPVMTVADGGAVTFTGAVSLTGANQLSLGTTGTNNGSVTFYSSVAGSGSTTLRVSSTTKDSNNRDIVLPDATGKLVIDSMLTTEGDIYYRNGSGLTRLARGSNGECLTSNTTTILWGACTGGSGITTVGAIDGGVYSANGASISGANIFLQTASATQVGLVNLAAQTFAGAKTFSSNLIASANVGINNSSAPNKLSVNSLVTADSLAQVAISTGATTNKGLVIQGVASQTESLAEFQSSTGLILSRINSDGSFTIRNSTGGSGDRAYLGDSALSLGYGGASTGRISLNRIGDSFGVTLWPATSMAASRNIYLPDATGTLVVDSTLTTEGDIYYRDGTGLNRLARGSNGQCLTTNTTTIAWGSCGSGGSTLQGAYTAGTAGDQVIALTTANDSLIFRNPAASGSDSTYILTLDQLDTGAKGGLDIQSAGTSNLLKITDTTATARDVLVVADGGAITFRNQTNSASAFAVQRAASGDTIFYADTTNNRIKVGDSTATTGADTTLFVIDNATSTNQPTGVAGGMYYDTTAAKFKCYTSGWVDCDTTGGGGSSAKKITFVPEYAGGLLKADGTSNNGTMTTDYISGLTSGEGYKHNYYEWSTSQASAQDYDIIINHQLPSDFNATTEFDSNTWKAWTYVGNSTDAEIKMWIYDNAGGSCASNVDLEGASTGWAKIDISDFDGSCVLAANDIITIVIKVTSKSPATNKVRVAEIQYGYTN